jgi:hypothetical protein
MVAEAMANYMDTRRGVLPADLSGGIDHGMAARARKRKSSKT